jgi:hypothetical protein
VYEFDIGDLTVDECEQIEKFTSARGLGDWSNQMSVANTRALQALWWVIRRQGGENPGPIAARDPAFRPVRLNEAYVAAERAAAEEAAAALAAAAPGAGEAAGADPTPAGSSPESSAATTTTPARGGPRRSPPG